MNLEKVIEALADERSIEEVRIQKIIEEAYEEAAYKKFGEGYDFSARYEDNDINLYNSYVAKENPTQPKRQIEADGSEFHKEDELVFQVHTDDPEKQQKLEGRYGSLIDLPRVGEEDFNRIAIGHARSLLSEELDSVNKERAHKLYKDQIGEIVSGRVRYISEYNIAVDLGKTKAILPKNQTLPNEIFDDGDTVTAVVKKVNPPNKDEQIILSRTDPQFVAALFKEDVEEIRDGRIELKDVVREAGHKTKMSVLSGEKGLSSVGPCIGRDGIRVMNISNKLGGERIDIIPFTTNLETYAEYAIGQNIDVLYSEEKENEVVIKVKEEDMKHAIGKKGRNIRLASRIIGEEIQLDSVKVGS